MPFPQGFPSNAGPPASAPNVQPVAPVVAPIVPGFVQGFNTPAQSPTLGVASTMASLNITLSNLSPAFQSFSPNTSNLTISLPNATSLQVASNAPTYLLRNTVTTGVFPAQILDGSGNLVGWSMPGATTPVYLENNSTVAGQWRVCTGNRSYDSGIYEWGTPIQWQSTAAMTLAMIETVGTHMLDAELGILTDITLGGSTTTTPVAIRAKDGAMQLGASGTALTTLARNYIIDTCSNGSAEVLIGYGGATQPTVASYTINTSTLALTQAANKVGAVKATTFIGMDSIATSNNILVYTESTTLKAWIAMMSGTGAGLTHNTAVQWSATTTMLAVQVAGLSATLCHGLYWDGATIYLNRSTIAGTVPTPGTQSTIANRGHISNSFVGTIQIVKIDATHSLAVYPGKNSNAQALGGTLFGNVITDTGSGITQNEVRLVDDFYPGALQSKFQNLIFSAAYKGVNGSINCIFMDGACYKLAVVKSISGTPVISAMIDIKLPGPLWSTTAASSSFAIVPSCMKGVSGSYVMSIPTWSGGAQITTDFTTAGSLEASLSFMPVCIAPQ